jgi:hypothetical protein
MAFCGSYRFARRGVSQSRPQLPIPPGEDQDQSNCCDSGSVFSRGIVSRTEAFTDQERSTGVRQETRIDDLIQLGLQLLGHGFDAREFEDWRDMATDCLSAAFGPDHTYSKYFCEYVRSPQDMDVLTAKGILAAAKEMIANNQRSSHAM